MKLASLHDGSRDGQLVVVSRDLATAHHASAVATRMQQVLDDWNFLSPQLEDLYAALNAGKARHAFPFDPRQCMAPLPRAFCCARARDQAAPAADALEGAPRLELGRGDALLGPREDMVLGDGDAGLACAAALAAISGDIAPGAGPTQALEGVRLLVLLNDGSLPAGEAAADAPDDVPPHGQALHAPVATAFAPVAVTPDELGAAWRDGRVHLPLQMRCNDDAPSAADAAAGMAHGFGVLLAALARLRGLRAGSLVGSEALLRAVVRDAGSAAAPQGANPAHAHGGALPRAVGRVRVEMTAAAGGSLFGAIEQGVLGADGTRAG